MHVSSARETCISADDNARSRFRNLHDTIRVRLPQSNNESELPDFLFLPSNIFRLGDVGERERGGKEK